ncbi:MAG: hypothetical protein JXJ22_04725 [Bacteroidales bacterium]|nr:hypothetical protein [Bacteroidales bacterium]
MENKHYLIVKDIGNIFKNKFEYFSRRATFYDPVNNIEQELVLHERHAGDQTIWKSLETDGLNAKFIGEIKNLKINEDLIRSVRSYKNAKIHSYKEIGTFVIFEFADLNSKGQLQMALKNQLWKFVKAKDVLFDADELIGDEFYKKE